MIPLFAHARLRLCPLALSAGLAALAFAPQADAQFDTRNWYRLQFDVFGTGRSVDVLNDSTDDKLAMARTGSFTGQYWRFEETGVVNYYRISCRWQGTQKVLSVDSNNLAVLVPPANDSRQLWKISANRFTSGAFEIANQRSGGNHVLKARHVTPDRYRLELVPSRDHPNRALRITALGPIDPASIAQVGTGCSAGAGLLLLGPVGDNLPWIGETMIGQMRGVPSGAASTLLVGVLRPRPIDLAFLGAPGCVSYVDGLVATSLPVRLNISRWTLPIPDNEALVGVQVHVQGVVTTTGNQIGTSNAARLTLGAR